jgi:hypothetical protein
MRLFASLCILIGSSFSLITVNSQLAISSTALPFRFSPAKTAAALKDAAHPLILRVKFDSEDAFILGSQN